MSKEAIQMIYMNRPSKECGTLQEEFETMTNEYLTSIRSSELCLFLLDLNNFLLFIIENVDLILKTLRRIRKFFRNMNLLIAGSFFSSGTQCSTLSDKCLTRWVKVRFLPRISPIRQYSLCNNTRKVIYIGLSVQRNASCFILQTLYNSPFAAGCLQITGNYEELRLVKAVTSWKSTTFVCPVRGHGHLNDLKVITLFLSIQVTDDRTCTNNSIHVITILIFILFLGYFLCYVHYIHVPMPNFRH
jgi:hypothetical protein